MTGAGKFWRVCSKKNQKLERAWAWLYACVKTDDQRIYCLKKVIQLNPNHEKAKAKLEEIIKRQNLQATVRSVPKQDRVKSAEKEKNAGPKTDIQSASSLADDPARLDETENIQTSKFKTVFIKPKVIFNNPNENLYALTSRNLTDFPEVDSGMYGSGLILGGIYISSYDYPRCVDAGRIIHKSQCYICDFFSESDCPIRSDPSILHEVKTLFAQRKRFLQEGRDRRDAIVDAIHTELKCHGRPLHYEVLARIIRDRYPNFRLNPRKILRIMGWRPEKFERVDIGVYRAK